MLNFKATRILIEYPVDMSTKKLSMSHLWISRFTLRFNLAHCCICCSACLIFLCCFMWSLLYLLLSMLDISVLLYVIIVVSTAQHAWYFCVALCDHCCIYCSVCLIFLCCFMWSLLYLLLSMLDILYCSLLVIPYTRFFHTTKFSRIHDLF